MTYRFLSVIAAMAVTTGVSPCQQATAEQAGAPVQEGKRVFWILPDYRSPSDFDKYTPLTVSAKLSLAAQDSFNGATVVVTAMVGAEAQLTNYNRSFGQGGAGFGRYFGASYGDAVIGNYMTEGILPAILHQDPRYFRRGTGGTWARLGYAAGTIVWTHRDSGGMQFNYSEIAGNSIAVAISNGYYADNRTAGDNLARLGVQIGADMVSNIFKEFYPDIKRKFRRK